MKQNLYLTLIYCLDLCEETCADPSDCSDSNAHCNVDDCVCMPGYHVNDCGKCQAGMVLLYM